MTTPLTFTPIPYGEVIRVYRNVRRDALSVQRRGPQGWRVAGYLDRVVLTDAQFIVNSGGYFRFLSNGRKNVHAFVEGAFASPDDEKRFSLFTPKSRATYNPRWLSRSGYPSRGPCFMYAHPVGRHDRPPLTHYGRFSSEDSDSSDNQLGYCIPLYRAPFVEITSDGGIVIARSGGVSSPPPSGRRRYRNPSRRRRSRPSSGGSSSRPSAALPPSRAVHLNGARLTALYEGFVSSANPVWSWSNIATLYDQAVDSSE